MAIENITKRLVKGTDLTYQELDDNFSILDSRYKTDIVAPTVTDDNSKGFITNKSIWHDTVADLIYKCTDATIGSAVWEELQSGGSVDFLDSVAPIVHESEVTLTALSPSFTYTLDPLKTYEIKHFIKTSATNEVTSQKKTFIYENTSSFTWDINIIEFLNIGSFSYNYNNPAYPSHNVVISRLFDDMTLKVQIREIL